MWRIITPKLLSLLLIFAQLLCVSRAEVSDDEYANQEWANSGQDIATCSQLVESQIQRLAYTENILRRTLSLMLTSEQYSAVQSRLGEDEIIKSFLSDDLDLFAASRNEGVKKTKTRWKRQVNPGLRSMEDRVKTALQSAVVPSKPSQSIARSSARSAHSLTENSDKIEDTPQNVPTSPLTTSETSTSKEAPLNARNAPTDRNGTALKIEDQLVTQKNLKDVVSTLQNVMKCSLAQRSDNAKETLGVLTELSVNVSENAKVSIQFQLKTCVKFWTGAWVNISRTSRAESDDRVLPSASESYFYRIPKECFKRKGLFYFIEIPSNSSTPCYFERPILRECHVYHVEVQGVFLELQGIPTKIDIVFLPGRPSEQTGLKAFNANATRNSLSVEWSVNSNVCAAMLSSVHLKINEEAVHVDEPAASYSYSIPRNCIESYESDDIVFLTSLIKPSSLGNNQVTTPSSCFDDCSDFSSTEQALCPRKDWRPLDKCRKYRLELIPEYSSLHQGKSSTIEIFTSSNTNSYCCHLLTEETGSINWNDPINKGCSWLVSAKKGQQIWLTFSVNFNIPCSWAKLKVFDGSYETSPLLSEYCDGSNEARTSIRSRSNKIFIKLVTTGNEYYYSKYERTWFSGHYMAVAASSTPFTPGCGGYIVDTGIISKPSYPQSDESSSKCFFYIRSSDKTRILSITSNNRHNTYENVTNGTVPIQVHADWSQKELLYSFSGSNQTNSSDESKARLAVYSTNGYMLVTFPAWNLAEREKELSWTIQAISTGCNFNLSSDIGTIESPNYPQPYDELKDCRWTIHSEENTKIRLTFAYIGLTGAYDYLTIYDGSTLNSKILKEFSDRQSKPITVTSKTNALMVRLTSSQRSKNYYKGLTRFGFLGVYTTAS